MFSAAIQPMDTLQPVLPSPNMVPREWPMVIIDLQDCFYTIPLAKEDCLRFAFTVPSISLKEPSKHYQWKVLPHGMLNSPTICQKYVAKVIQPVRKKIHKSISFTIWLTFYVQHRILNNYKKSLHA